jgi:tripartite-type tricarboxylate transporter receptor subunit TctC
MTVRLSRRGMILGSASVALAGPARADVFAGKFIMIICGYNPGGGVDIGTRLIAKHLVRFLPGDVKAAVKNMQGASGIVAANYLYQKAAPDGLTLGVPGRDWLPKPALGNPNTLYDPQNFAYIGSTGGTSNIGWFHADTGIRDLDDFRRSPRKIVFGGLPQNTMLSSLPKLLAEIGLPVQVIMGYENTARIVHAIEQKELDAIYTAETSMARRRDLVDSKILLPLFQSEPDLAGIPLVDELVPEQHRPTLRMIHASATFGMPLVAPPGTPDDRVAVLRHAFMNMALDPAFQADAKAVGEPYGNPIEGGKLAAIVKATLEGATPATVQAVRRLTGE